jgi:hypothetical protein
MHVTRRLVFASALAVLMTVVFLPGAGVGSAATAARDAQKVPSGLAAAIQARFGSGRIPASLTAAIRARFGAGRASSGWAARVSQPGPGLGVSISLSADGTTALVGAPGVAHSKGAAYIYHVTDAGSWVSTDMPTASLMNTPGPAPDQLVGYRVALSADGTTAFVGAPLAGSGVNSVGRIFVFHVADESSWVNTTTPTATLKVSDGIFVGISLQATPDGTTVLAGAPFFNSFAGAAYIFHVASETSWVTTATPTATLSNDAESRDDNGVGFAVALSSDGTTALLGDDQNPTHGGAYVYNVATSADWATTGTPTAILSDSFSDPSDGLGNFIALSGDGTVAFLGAPGANNATGYVDVFHSSAENAWASTTTPTATLTDAGGQQGDFFGYRVVASTDGTKAFFTAPGVNNFRGAIDVFSVADESSWVTSGTPAATLTNSAGKANDELGIGATLSSDGATLIAGAPEVKFETGAGDVFHVTDESSWVTSSTPTAILTDSALNNCFVPKIIGKKLTLAKAFLKVRSCRVGKVTHVLSKKGKKGRVISQSAKPGVRLAFDAKINIKIKK